MRAREVASTMYGVVTLLQGLTSFLLVAMGASMRADPEEWRARAYAGAGVLETSQQLGWVALPLLAVVSGALGLVRTYVGPPSTWKTLHHFLNVFREESFKNVKEDPEHHHRVTLFKYVRYRWWFCRWPWTGWVRAVERSGHTTHRRGIVYRAPDEADDAEGVAGRAWVTKRVILVSKLPDLHTAPSEEDFRVYAEQTFVSVAWAKKHRPSARSLCGIPVEVSGTPWGVIVLDSRDPDGVAKNKAEYRTFAKYLSKLVERI
jgi:hypothetical protein